MKLHRDDKLVKHALIVDEHPIVRKGVKDLLQETFPFLAIKATTGNGDVVELISRRRWSFVLLDINLPGQNGIDVIKQVKVKEPFLPIVVFSNYPERQYADRSIRAGASAYISKQSEPKDLVRTVKSVLCIRGRSKFPPMRLSKPTLSNRELQVLNLLVKGMSRKAISEMLGIDHKTVGTYRLRLFAKLQVRNNMELLRYALDERLL